MSFLKKIKELFTNPHEEQTHGDWFYHTKVYSKKIVIFYKQLTQQLANNEVVKTPEIIVPLNLVFGSNINQIIEKWGKPRSSFNNKKTDKNIQILFYRKDYVYQHTLFQLQFYNGLLFFVGVETGKTLLTDVEKVKMIGSFLPNLVTDNCPSIQSIPVFVDINNHFLIVEDEVNISINYLSNLFIDNLMGLEEGIKNGFNLPKK